MVLSYDINILTFSRGHTRGHTRLQTFYYNISTQYFRMQNISAICPSVTPYKRFVTPMDIRAILLLARFFMQYSKLLSAKNNAKNSYSFL
jgi:hypothetical protein